MCLLSAGVMRNLETSSHKSPNCSLLTLYTLVSNYRIATNMSTTAEQPPHLPPGVGQWLEPGGDVEGK